MSNIESNIVTLEVISDVAKATLDEALRAACLHEEATNSLKKAGTSVAAVVFRQGVEVMEQVKKFYADAGKDYNPTTAKVKFAESLAASEARIKDESSQWKHMKKLPACWVQAKSDMSTGIELECDFNRHKSVASVKKWNAEERVQRELAATAAELKEMGGNLTVVGEEKGSDTTSAPKSPANVEKSTTQTEHVTVNPVVSENEGDAMSPEVLAVLQELATVAAQLDPVKAVKMLAGVKSQMLAAVSAAAMKQAV